MRPKKYAAGKEKDEKEYKVSFEILAAHRIQTTTKSPASLGGVSKG